MNKQQKGIEFIYWTEKNKPRRFKHKNIEIQEVYVNGKLVYVKEGDN